MNVLKWMFLKPLKHTLSAIYKDAAARVYVTTCTRSEIAKNSHVAHAQKQNPLQNGRCPLYNHARKFSWWSIKGFKCGGGSNFALSHCLWSSFLGLPLSYCRMSEWLARRHGEVRRVSYNNVTGCRCCSTNEHQVACRRTVMREVDSNYFHHGL